MRSILHIITKPGDTLSREVITQQQSELETKIEVIDLTLPEPDYKVLAEKIFAADSVQVW